MEKGGLWDRLMTGNRLQKRGNPKCRKFRGRVTEEMEEEGKGKESQI